VDEGTITGGRNEWSDLTRSHNSPVVARNLGQSESAHLLILLSFAMRSFFNFEKMHALKDAMSAGLTVLYGPVGCGKTQWLHELRADFVTSTSEGCYYIANGCAYLETNIDPRRQKPQDQDVTRVLYWPTSDQDSREDIRPGTNDWDVFWRRN
jgi:hypothetical protein